MRRTRSMCVNASLTTISRCMTSGHDNSLTGSIYPIRHSHHVVYRLAFNELVKTEVPMAVTKSLGGLAERPSGDFWMPKNRACDICVSAYACGFLHNLFPLANFFFSSNIKWNHMVQWYCSFMFFLM